jgi:hypothetical protein
MENIITFFAISCAIQIFHSLEEIVMRFEKFWPLWKMKRVTFISFEILFSLLFLYVLLFAPTYQLIFAKLFLLTMFANGVWHIFWGWSDRKYVPGLVTAPLHIINLVIFFLQI